VSAAALISGTNAISINLKYAYIENY